MVRYEYRELKRKVTPYAILNLVSPPLIRNLVINVYRGLNLRWESCNAVGLIVPNHCAPAIALTA